MERFQYSGGGKNEDDAEREVESTFSFAPCYESSNMMVGDELVAQWEPDRRCVFRCVRKGMFEVVEAENSKLSVGDTFSCDVFIDGEELHVINLTHKGVVGLTYVAGKVNGVKYTYRPK